MKQSYPAANRKSAAQHLTLYKIQQGLIRECEEVRMRSCRCSCCRFPPICQRVCAGHMCVGCHMAQTDNHTVDHVTITSVHKGNR